MKVLVIPEDPTLDQHILKPVVQRIFRDLNRKARVYVLQDPRLGSVSEALDKGKIGEILERHRMMDLFLLIVDRDGVRERQDRVDARVAQADEAGKTMLGCMAVEEVEVWALALHRSEVGGSWDDVRNEVHPKEIYFDPFVKRNKWLEGLGRGRAQAMRSLAGNWKTLKSLCPELQHLEDEIAQWLADR
ncbi:MAG: hypothetical protein HQ567_04880 [Candidatus Nealsonbacteria bacterium]|nr:hypothetical protein [Candidatus Nealsonbacteria bacterium]